MSNDDTQPAVPPASGSRWEPAEQPPAATPVAYAPAPPPRQPRQHRGRLLLAGGAVGIALVAGAGGFALGHVTADDRREGIGQFGPQGQGGFPGTFPGGGPQGTFPGQGQPPPNGFPDRRDGDDQQQLPDDDDDITPAPSTS